MKYVGRLWYEYNGAGILDAYGNIIDTEAETFNPVLRLDVSASFLAIKEVMPTFVEKGKGMVINIGPQGSKFAAVGGTSYITTKDGLVGFDKQLAFDFGSKGVKSSLLAPGYIETPMTDGLEEPRLQDIPNQRAGKPEEITNLALFIASDDSNCMNGPEVYIDE